MEHLKICQVGFIIAPAFFVSVVVVFGAMTTVFNFLVLFVVGVVVVVVSSSETFSSTLLRYQQRSLRCVYCAQFVRFHRSRRAKQPSKLIPEVKVVRAGQTVEFDTDEDFDPESA